ncbi:hypothetical protein NKJ56_30520, partial [Mesorhizobium sp. M0093]
GCLAVTTSDLAVTIAVSVICGREDPANFFEGFVASSGNEAARDRAVSRASCWPVHEIGTGSTEV